MRQVIQIGNQLIISKNKLMKSDAYSPVIFPGPAPAPLTPEQAIYYQVLTRNIRQRCINSFHNNICLLLSERQHRT